MSAWYCISGALSSVTGAIGSLATGALSGLSGLFTATGGVLTKVGTPIMTSIASYLGPMARDEAYKSYHQTKNKTTTDNTHTVDVEAEKAKREMYRQIANWSEEKFPGSGNWIYWILSSIPAIANLCTMCCKSFKTKKEVLTEINPPAPAEVAVTPTKRARARNKSPAPTPKSKSK
jgi:hypothetical protein